MGDVLKPVGQWIASNIPLSVGIGLFLFCLFFEISKIKIYPLRWLWKLISWPFRKIDEQRTNSFKSIVMSMKVDMDAQLAEMKATTCQNCEQMKERFDKLEAQLNRLGNNQIEAEQRLDLLAAARIKNHVLNFARQCRKGESHSHEDFANLFKENKEYQALVKKYNWQNDVYTHDFAYIQRVYDDCNDKGEFLE
jgi:hypothetical protein